MDLHITLISDTKQKKLQDVPEKSRLKEFE